MASLTRCSGEDPGGIALAFPSCLYFIDVNLSKTPIPSKARQKAKAQTRRFKLENILLVDDDDWVLDSVGCFLQQVGYEVTTARSGKEGISLIDSGYEYDLVITDIRMPGISGNELAKYIRDSDWPYVPPIVAITGYNDGIDQELFDCILQKPFDFKVLAKTIKMLINKNTEFE
jgi:CheY-like chemotaxis protein